MQKYKSNLTSVSGAAVRGASITVLDESGVLASIFLDRAGTLSAGNPLKTAQDGTFEFYAANGRYSLRTDSSGLNVLEEDVILTFDPDDATVSGPIAEAIQGANEAAQQAQDSADEAQESADKAQQIVVNTVPTFGTYQLAVSGLGSVQTDMLLEVSQDETHAGARTRYFKRAGDILEFAVNLDQLRLDLKREDGAARVGFKQPGDGTVSTTVDSELRKHVSPDQYGAAGDGIADDTEAFAELEAAHIGISVNLLGKTYAVDVIPFGNKYWNGFFKVGIDLTQANYQPPMNGRNRYVLGDRALVSLPVEYDVGSNGSVIAIGANAMRDTVAVKKSIAIGPRAMGESVINRDNIAIGEDALQRVQSRTADYSQTEQQGTRNIAIGTNSQNFTHEGYRNVTVGRNSGQTIVNGIDNTAIGMNAMNGEVMFGLSGLIENNSPYNGIGSTAVGSYALSQYVGNGPMVALGQYSAEKARTGSHGTAIGYGAARGADGGIDGFGKIIAWEGAESGTYVHTGNTLSITVPNLHGAAVGYRVRFRLLDGDSKTALTDSATAVVTSIDGNTIQVFHPIYRNASGLALLQRVSTLEAATSNARDYVAIGSNACANTNDLRDSVVVGMSSANSTNSVYRSTVLGSNSVRFCKEVFQSVVIGRVAAAGTSSTPINNVTASVIIGENSAALMTDGSPVTSLTGVVMLGDNTRVSGNNQVQLGKAGTTTYAYGSIQDRSDERDKADIKDIEEIWDEFLMRHEVKQGRWDMRDDYIIHNDDGSVDYLPKDGSKKRLRFHNWFIAQQVLQICQDLDIDFAGLQHHEKNGGCDIYTIGYSEYIPLILWFAQRNRRRIIDLENRLNAAGI